MNKEKTLNEALHKSPSILRWHRMTKEERLDSALPSFQKYRGAPYNASEKSKSKKRQLLRLATLQIGIIHQNVDETVILDDEYLEHILEIEETSPQNDQESDILNLPIARLHISSHSTTCIALTLGRCMRIQVELSHLRRVHISRPNGNVPFSFDIELEPDAFTARVFDMHSRQYEKDISKEEAKRRLGVPLGAKIERLTGTRPNFPSLSSTVAALVAQLRECEKEFAFVLEFK